MALLEGRELLQREGVHPAQHGQRTFGPAQPLLLLLAHVRREALGRLRVVVRGRHRDGPVRAELLEKHLRVQAELLDAAGLELFDAKHLLCPRDLVPMRGVGQLGQLGRGVIHVAASRDQRGVPLGTRGLGGTPRPVGLGQRTVQQRESAPRGRRDVASECGLRGTPHGPRRRELPRLPLGRRGTLQRLGTAGHRPDPFLQGAQRQPSLGLLRPRGRRLRRRGVPHRHRLDQVRLGLGRVGLGTLQSLGELRQLPLVTGEPLVGCAECRRGTLRLGARRPGHRAEVPELLRDRGERGVGLVQPVERGLVTGLRLGSTAPSRHEREPGALPRGDRVRHRGPRLRERRLQLEQPGPAARPTPGARRAEQVPGAGHRHEVGPLVHQGPGVGQVVDHHDLRQRRRDRDAQVVGRSYQLDSGDRTVRQAGPVRLGAGRLRADQQRGAPAVELAQPAQGIDGRLHRSHRHRIGEWTEGGGDGVLVAGLDAQQCGHRAEHTGEVVGRQQGPGPVLAFQAQLEGLDLGLPGGAVALGRLIDPLELRDGGRGLLELEARPLVLGVQALLALLGSGHRRLERREVHGRGMAATLGLGEGLLQAADLGLGGLQTGAAGRHLAGQPGQALATVRGGALQVGDPALGGRGRLLDLAASCHCSRPEPCRRAPPRPRAPPRQPSPGHLGTPGRPGRRRRASRPACRRAAGSARRRASRGHAAAHAARTAGRTRRRRRTARAPRRPPQPRARPTRPAPWRARSRPPRAG